MTTFRISKLAQLVGGWGKTSLVRSVTEDLIAQLEKSKQPFAGASLPTEFTKGRLPPGIRSAWIFVIKPKAKPPLHRHPNSIQHMAVLSGGGHYTIGRRNDVLQPFDPAFPERSLYVIPENMPHTFEPANEHLVVMSFHTAADDELVEEEVESGSRRKYR
jgi:mannose-6-phosphate isomerase-like protein (cupin superfamily)